MKYINLPKLTNYPKMLQRMRKVCTKGIQQSYWNKILQGWLRIQGSVGCKIWWWKDVCLCLNVSVHNWECRLLSHVFHCLAMFQQQTISGLCNRQVAFNSSTLQPMLQTNVDWFQPLKHSQYSSGALYLFLTYSYLPLKTIVQKMWLF